ncbi:adhesion protein FadA [Fusobacterium varium]|uniref:adhesion protein FadA n=1 Tax=Fusobacterium varium TaxID=856 RepID=UPI003569E0C7
MKKILIGCMLVISTVSYSAIEAASTFEQLELTFQQLEAEEAAMYNQRKTEAEEAEKALISLRAKYQKILETEKYIIEVEQYRYYQEDYKELLKKCRTMKGELEAEIAAKEEIIDIYKAIM